MDKLKSAIVKANKIEEFLSQDYVKSAWVSVEADIFRMWALTKTHEQEKREEYYRELHGLRAVKARLQKWVNEGKKAEAELEVEKRHG